MHSMTMALWARSTKNPDKSTGPLARSFACSLTPLTRLLAPPCLLCSRAHSLTCGTMNDWMAIYSVFFSVLDYSEMMHSMTVACNDDKDEIP